MGGNKGGRREGLAGLGLAGLVLAGHQDPLLRPLFFDFFLVDLAPVGLIFFIFSDGSSFWILFFGFFFWGFSLAPATFR